MHVPLYIPPPAHTPCIVLHPPPQVAVDFEYCGKAFNLTSVCLYGGTQYGPQEGLLRRGVDVVIGTPGRVKDHLERGTLNLRWVLCLVGGRCWAGGVGVQLQFGMRLHRPSAACCLRRARSAAPPSLPSPHFPHPPPPLPAAAS